MMKFGIKWCLIYSKCIIWIVLLKFRGLDGCKYFFDILKEICILYLKNIEKYIIYYFIKSICYDILYKVIIICIWFDIVIIYYMLYVCNVYFV